MLVQIHILQNYAPSNLNRDDTGSPKDAFFGGLKRGRVSSQCIKRSIRKSSIFTDNFKDKGLIAKRTQDLPKLIDAELKTLQVDDNIREAIVARVTEIGQSGKDSSSKKSDNEDEDKLKTRQLIFLDPKEISPLAEKLFAAYKKIGHTKWTDTKSKNKLTIRDIEKELGESIPLTVDVAMFGRMTTSAAFEDVQAAVQVAHSLTTSAVETEFDYFTAVDDISGESGAGMIGDVEFNSATHYKYFNIHWEELVKNLGGDEDIAKEAVLALLEAAATTQPSGKQNSFAAHNLPDLILVEVSERNLPVSYANAFLKPVRQTYDKSLMDASVAALDDYAKRLRKVYGLNGGRAYTAVGDYTVTNAIERESLADLETWLAAQLP